MCAAECFLGVCLRVCVCVHAIERDRTQACVHLCVCVLCVHL